MTVKLKARDTDWLKHSIYLSGYTISGMADEIGITKNYLSSVIHGSKNPGPKVALKIASMINRRLGTKYLINDIFFDNRVAKL